MTLPHATMAQHVSRMWRRARWVMLVCVKECICKPITPLLGSVYELGEEAPIQELCVLP